MCWIPDYSIYFDMISEYARYMNGAVNLFDLLKMRSKEFFFWYRIHERGIIRDGIVTDLISRNKPIPSHKRLNRMIDKELERRQEES